MKYIKHLEPFQHATTILDTFFLPPPYPERCCSSNLPKDGGTFACLTSKGNNTLLPSRRSPWADAPPPPEVP